MMKYTLEELGPQSWKSDNVFTRRARLLQSYYRCEVNEPIVTGPNKSDTRLLGSMLRNGDSSGKNYLTDDIFQYAFKRERGKSKKETIEPFRFFNNLLSSQPMCFNFFQPLMKMREEFPQAVNEIFRVAFPTLQIHTVDEIRIEFIPVPTEKYIDDDSAMDASVFCSDVSGKKILISFETKYVDSLGINIASRNEKKYAFAKETGYFTVNGLEEIKKGCAQIYRNFFLAEKYSRIHGYENCLSVILAPNGNPTTEYELQSFRANLLPEHQHRMIKMDLEIFVSVIQKHSPEEFKDWINAFKARYLNFEIIEPYYELLKKTGGR